MADTQIKELKTKRGQIRAAVTRFGTFLQSIDMANITSVYQTLKTRHAKFEQALEQFNAIQLQLELLCETEASDLNTEYEEFETIYFEYLANADEKLATCESSKIATQEQNFAFQSAVAKPRMRLPEIDMPKFSGSFEDWNNFYDTFNSLINSNESISAVEKFNYLKSALRGQAAEILHSLEITESNYNTAWEMLKERYDNKRLIIQTHIKAICDLPNCLKENASTLRQILDGTQKHVRALAALNRPTDYWDDMLIYLISNKLDCNTIRAWELTIAHNSIPVLKDLLDFLAQRCQVLDMISRTEKMQVLSQKPISKKSTCHAATSQITCSLCNENHLIYNCEMFLALSTDQRIREIKAKGLCTNCLKNGHYANTCKSSSCRKCNKRHNTLLHLEQAVLKSEGNIKQSSSNSTVVANSFCQPSNKQQIVLSTALVKVYGKHNQIYNCRALLDSGSQSCFMSERLANKLGVVKQAVQIAVGGINQSHSHVNYCVQVKIASRFNNFQLNAQCFLLPKITDNLPSYSFSKSSITIPPNIKLADPDFNKSQEIDLLIGAEFFWNLLCVGQIKTARDQPYLQKTHFGWLVSGIVPHRGDSSKTTICNVAFENESSLHKDLALFWKLEDCCSTGQYSKEEAECETIFKNTTVRNTEGRFIVKLPIKLDIMQKIGDTYEQAVRRFKSLEKRFRKDYKLKEQYANFIKEYLDLGHMRPATRKASADLPDFYLPHHAVFKEDSLTTKLRVVFDGSAKSTTGVSLNDALMVGPTIQEDLVSLLLRFRSFKYAITADIAKMYRQVWVHESHTQLQRILWRENDDAEIKAFELLTVTYGTAPAAFLAIRVLHQLAHEEEQNFPLGAKILLRDFYVDDLLTGAQTLSDAEQIIQQIKPLLHRGCFQLRKWISNHPSLLSKVLESSIEHNLVDLNKSETAKTLGLQWDSKGDIFKFSICPVEQNHRITKRTMLSHIAKIFDPLGLLGPIITYAKIIMQQLWQVGLAWDESVPLNVYIKWTNFCRTLGELNNLNIPRFIGGSRAPISIQLHGFSDASEAAYGACIYARVIYSDEVVSRLICSKSRVAPLKSISLPKLELCGALLLARLLRKTVTSIDLTVAEIYCWTDSTIVLAWIASSARSWKTFVSNRVGEIQDLTDPAWWRHVPTDTNPADPLSRGMVPEQLIECRKWWNGPDWLRKQPVHWPIRNLASEAGNIPERRACMAAVISGNPFIFHKFSSLRRMSRVIAYCLRFIYNSRKIDKGQTGPITADEIDQAVTIIIKIAQAECFSRELQELAEQGQVHKRSQLMSLNPFLDGKGLIRVGGRLRKAQIPYDQKHQIILPKAHHITKLIVRSKHIESLHAGIQGTLAAIRMFYWPINARNLVRQIVRGCITCFRANPVPSVNIMGDLPAARLTPSRPFTCTGVDYFGPLFVREGKRKNSKSIKAYGAIFICFSTKAIHIELATDLSTETFINVLKRFMSRRGKPQIIYSDNGKNFVGANRELAQLKDMFERETETSKIISTMSNCGIRWHFIPPRSPHFGGLWEAAVKSAKHHLKRVVGQAALSFEEMYTVLVQIEAILNSRPLTPMSDDPNDLSCLTPGHFLIGDSLTSPADSNLLPLALNRLSRWQLVERLRQHFWARWSKEYLNQLQLRSRWKKSSKPLKIDQLVLVREDNVPPLQWPMGRITSIHPGADGVPRVVTIRTAKSVYKRAAIRLCPLPLED